MCSWGTSVECSCPGEQGSGHLPHQFSWFHLAYSWDNCGFKNGRNKKSPKKPKKAKQTNKNLQRSDYFFHSNCSKAWTFSEITSLLKTIFPPCVQSKVPFLPTAYKRRLIHKLKGKLHSSQALVQRIIFSKKHLHHNCCLRPDPCRMRTQWVISFQMTSVSS